MPSNECLGYSAVMRIPKATELEWLLSLNEEENKIVRSEFYYEQVREEEGKRSPM